MEILQAILLGIIEGLTEFLPISSTGHLIISEDLIGYKDTAEIFTVVIQTGAILAVIWLYRSDLINRVVGLFRRDKQAINFWVKWVIATIPAGAVGFALKDQITEYAVALTVGISLVVGGVLIWLIENYHTTAEPKSSKGQIDKITMSQAVRIGLFQVIALIPGVSRSGATIMGGLLSGLDRVSATAFSFYLSIPIILVAGAYQLVNGHDDLSTVSGGASALIVGSIVSFITALVAIKWLLRYVSSHDFKPFAYYRIALGLVILAVVLL